MDLSLLLNMAASGFGDRVVLGSSRRGITSAELHARARSGAAVITESGASAVVFLARNGPAFVVALFAGAAAAVPVVPLNYRLAPDRLRDMISANEPALVIAEDSMASGLGHPRAVLTPEKWLERTGSEHGTAGAGDGSDPGRVALLLYTSGTTGQPKAAVLRHQQLISYVLSTVEFGSAGEDQASLVSVPPYHIAGVASTITNLYAGRRILHLPEFTPRGWLQTVRAEGVTNALVVPTMLARLVAHLGAEQPDVPTLRTVAYGGAAMPASVIEQALSLFPAVDFVNAYGLTETSSTIALLGPDDHRAAFASEDPQVRARLRSAGRLIPGLEAQIRSSAGKVLPRGEAGELWVRGPQVSGEYLGSAPSLDGWFCTRDQAYVDAAGYLFVLGRVDDTIIRGGENIAPAEIEEVLRAHPAVADAAVVGLPDEEWGQRIAAAVVAGAQPVSPGQLREHVRSVLRSSKTPDLVVFVPDLPYNDLGKLSRQAVAELLQQGSPG